MTNYERNETLREIKYMVKNQTGKNIPMTMMVKVERKMENCKMIWAKFTDFRSKNVYEVTETWVKENGKIISA